MKITVQKINFGQRGDFWQVVDLVDLVDLVDFVNNCDWSSSVVSRAIRQQELQSP